MSHKPSQEVQEELKPLRNLQQTEQKQNIFRKFRNTLRPLRSGTLSRQVEVPQDLAADLSIIKPGENHMVSLDRGATTEITQRIVWHKCKANEEWVTIIDQPTLERAILLFCQQHFQQASSTPFGSDQLFHLLSASGLTKAGDQILDGVCPNLREQVSSEVLRLLVDLQYQKSLERRLQ